MSRLEPPGQEVKKGRGVESRDSKDKLEPMRMKVVWVLEAATRVV